MGISVWDSSVARPNQAACARLASLSPEHRGVLVELYYRARSPAEIATELGIPEGTVKSRTYYALRRLRAALEGTGVV